MATTPLETSQSFPLWIIENDTVVRYLGARYVYKNEVFYCVFSSHAPRLIKQVLAQDVYHSEKEARASLATLDCWYIEGNKIVQAKGRRVGGALVAYDTTTNSQIMHRDVFSSRAKAQGWLILQRRNEKRRKLR